MKTFTCSCKWTYIINRKGTKVIGPFFHNGGQWPEDPIHVTHKEPISYEQWADQYADCEARYEKERDVNV